MEDFYHVTVTREDGFWVGVVEGMRGGATEVRRLANLEEEVRDLLSGLLDVDPDDLTLTFDLSPALGDVTEKHLRHYVDVRNKLAHVQQDYESTQLEVVRELRDGGVSLRDAAALLDVSFQRVQQLASR